MLLDSEGNGCSCYLYTAQKWEIGYLMIDDDDERLNKTIKIPFDKIMKIMPHH